MDNKIRILEQLKKLKIQIKQTNASYFEKCYPLVAKYYDLALSIFPTYTIRQLSLDIDMAEQTAYRMISYKKSSTQVKELVKLNKITMPKAARICQSIQSNKQLDTVNYAIKNNLTSRQIEKHVLKNENEKVKEYDRKDNIVRDINNILTKLKIMNLSFINAKPLENDKEKVINTLNNIIAIAKLCIERIK